MKRVLYLVPGAGQSARGKHFTKIRTLFSKQGFIVIPVPVKWKRFDLGWLPEYARAVEKAVLREPHEKYVLGFSWGAVAALISARIVQPKALILCSLSPYFSEDRYFHEQFIGENKLSRYHTAKLEQRMMALPLRVAVRDVTARTFVLYGEREPLVLLQRCILAAALLNAELYVVPKARHDIAHKEYVKTIASLIDKL